MRNSLSSSRLLILAVACVIAPPAAGAEALTQVAQVSITIPPRPPRHSPANAAGTAGEMALAEELMPSDITTTFRGADGATRLVHTRVLQ